MSEQRRTEDSTYKPDFSKYESDKNHGITFGTYPMESFSGDVITPKNRKVFLMQYFIEHIQKMVEEGKIEGDSPITEELRAEAMRNASERVKLNMKAEKAWLKGKQYFNHRNQKYMIPTQQRIERSQQWLSDYKEKYEDKGEEE